MSQAHALKKTESKWYILRGENKFGPYDFQAMLSMIQNGELFDYNYIWSHHLEGWQLLGDVEDFSKDRLALLIKTKDPLSHAFNRRGSDRAEIKVQVHGHNGEFFFDGHITSVSVNGALLLLHNPLLLPGQKLIIHVSQSNVFEKSFNFGCQIVRKNFSRQRLNVKSGLNYAVRFEKMPTYALEQIRHVVELYHKVNAKE